MDENDKKLNILLSRLEILLKRHDEFERDINSLRSEIYRLKSAQNQHPIAEEKTEEKVTEPSRYYAPTHPFDEETVVKEKKIYLKSNIEKFIGENLINKIGILITVIGVAIGAKYSIEHELISPVTRIILGYLVGLVLLFLGMKLKEKYENFSAVLVSGAMAIMYFITYSAYDFYNLIPQLPAFGLMVVFTAFTVFAAIKYNLQVIAHIGLVGAYAVPFLLSDRSGRAIILFSYIAIINAGILILAFKKQWKPLYYSAFGITWLIFFTWYAVQYNSALHFNLALSFLTIFFAIFYATFLAYQLLRNEKFIIGDVILLLLNSFIFFGVGYAILSLHTTAKNYLGLFTLLNAVVHFTVSLIIYRQKLADKNILYLVTGLVMVFITIAIPVQLDGNWVTLMWAGEAALLFWIGRNRKVSIYELLSYPLMILALLSILHDWSEQYLSYVPEVSANKITPLINIYFLSSIIFIAAFAFINYIKSKSEYIPESKIAIKAHNLMNFLIPGILLFSVYYAFRIEIENYWHQQFQSSRLDIDSTEYYGYQYNYDYLSYKTIWIINYSLFFLSALSFINIYKIKDRQLGIINQVLNIVGLALFLTYGLYALSELRESYMDQSLSQFYNRDVTNILIRYISYVFVFLMLFSAYKYLRRKIFGFSFTAGLEMLFYITVLWLASSELINWMELARSGHSYKLGLSILWGVFSLFLIIIGIWKRKKHLRMGAIVLFGVTLVKLFFYDVSHLDTIPKTILFVSLGMLLLIISFLYNKYKHIISDEVKV